MEEVKHFLCTKGTVWRHRRLTMGVLLPFRNIGSIFETNLQNRVSRLTTKNTRSSLYSLYLLHHQLRINIHFANHAPLFYTSLHVTSAAVGGLFQDLSPAVSLWVWTVHAKKRPSPTHLGDIWWLKSCTYYQSLRLSFATRRGSLFQLLVTRISIFLSWSIPHESWLMMRLNHWEQLASSLGYTCRSW